jgi:hypothetical protein
MNEMLPQAADRGHPKAWHNLGYIYENGSGMARDAKKAVQCWTKAAEYGDMDAQYNLGTSFWRVCWRVLACSCACACACAWQGLLLCVFDIFHTPEISIDYELLST